MNYLDGSLLETITKEAGLSINNTKTLNNNKILLTNNKR